MQDLTANGQGNDTLNDVIICGAGVIGMVLAGLLLRQGLSVLLIEARPGPQTDEDLIDPRTLAITPASQSILQQTGIWSALDAQRLGRFQRIEVWDQAGSGRITFDARDSIQPLLGYIIENTHLHRAASQAIAGLPALNVLQPATVTALEFQPDRATVAVDNGMRVHGRLLVAADGQRSRVRDLAGIGSVADSYEQTAVAGVVKTTLGHGHTARQRFLDNGILALLPLWDAQHCGLVWSTDAAHAEALQAMSDARFCAELTRASEAVLGEVTACLSRQGFPLYAAQAERYCQPRLALIGDAAHSVHPLAGQGANLGIMDAAVLAEEIALAQSSQRDFAEHYWLRRFERRRRGDNILMMNVFSGFQTLYASRAFPVPGLRNLGMNLLDRATPVKRWIMQRAMGLSGDVPAGNKAADFL